MNKLRIPFILCMCLGFTWSALATGASGADVEITVHLDKPVYTAGEPFSGEITIFNPIPAVIPKTFFVGFYRDGFLGASRKTAISRVFFGTNTYTFEGLGIPQLTRYKYPLGHWKMNIKEATALPDDILASVEFDIVSP